jgi:sec-independent protein translocase protein TatA
MGDVAQGIKAFKKGMSDDEAAAASPATPDAAKTIDHHATETVTPQAESRKAS